VVVCGVVTLAVVVVVVCGVVVVLVVASVDVTSGDADAKVEGKIFLDNFRADF